MEILKKIIQSKITKKLFWFVFWGGNSMTIVILVYVQFLMYLYQLSGRGIFPNTESKFLIVLALAGWIFMLILLALLFIINFLFIIRWLVFKISNRNINQNFKKATILAVCFFVVLFACCAFFLALHKIGQALTVKEYLKCTTGVIKGHGPFVITHTGVCIKQAECRNLKKIINCENMDNHHGDWKVAENLSKNNFDFESLIMKDNCGDSECHSGAWFFDINNKTYFWWPYKGNGRLFEVDKETFRYLGNDRYEDKNGLIIKNTRVNK